MNTPHKIKINITFRSAPCNYHDFEKRYMKFLLRFLILQRTRLKNEMFCITFGSMSNYNYKNLKAIQIFPSQIQKNSFQKHASTYRFHNITGSTPCIFRHNLFWYLRTYFVRPWRQDTKVFTRSNQPRSRKPPPRTHPPSRASSSPPPRPSPTQTPPTERRSRPC